MRALIQLMRWSGLAIRDAVTLRREELIRDQAKKLFRIVTARQKTGTHVSAPIPPAVAQEILGVLNGNPVYVFWTGKGEERTAVSHWQPRTRNFDFPILLVPRRPNSVGLLDGESDSARCCGIA